MRKLALAVALLTAAPLQGGVQYYLMDKLTGADPARWVSVGRVSHGALGLEAPDPDGGALISKEPVPDGTAEAEVLATIALNSSGGVYTEYLQASMDANTGGNGSGSYLAFEMQNPTFDSGGLCAANFLVFQSVAGSVTLLSSFQHACRNGMLMRFAVHGNIALAWPDQATPVEFTITPGHGQPGIGSHGTPARNSVSLVQLGAIMRTPPTAVDEQAIGTTAFRDRIDVQWKPVAEDAEGALAGYWVYRDGSYFMRTTAPRFSDQAVSPGVAHTYTIKAVDQHFNFSAGTSITVATPKVAPAKR
jgi:hypothetical protein